MSAMRLVLAATIFCLCSTLTSAKCSKVDENIPIPSQLSTLQKQQIQKSLTLPGRYPSPKNSFDEACKASTWEEFAKNVGTQDFYMAFLRDATGTQYVYFDYGLGDNDFGSVHPRDSADPIIAINDGDWYGLREVTDSLVSCLKQAVRQDLATAVQKCNKIDEVIPAPSQLSTLEKQQIQKSLALPGRYPSPTSSFDDACKTSTWKEFAKLVGTQDFSVKFLRNAAGDIYIYFDYGLGDNDFGSVHPRDSVDPIISVNDGDWYGLGKVNTSLVTCLEQAVHPDEHLKGKADNNMQQHTVIV